MTTVTRSLLGGAQPLRRQRFARLGILLGLALAAFSCGGKTQDGTSGGNTSWLSRCASDDDCRQGQCYAGACTQACVDDATCRPLAAGALCAGSARSRCGPESSTDAVCARGCSADVECADIGEGYACSEGACVPPVARCASEDLDASTEMTSGDASTCSDEDCSGDCVVAGQRYANGESWGACQEFACSNGQVSANPILCLSCEVDGTVYPNGETFGECGECLCTQGSVQCQDACPSCDVDGVSVPYGASYPAADTCNSCVCGPPGGCTQRACATGQRCVYEGNLYAPEARFGQCDECVCSEGSVLCGSCDAVEPPDGGTLPADLGDASSGVSDAGDAAARPVVLYHEQLDGGQCVLIDGVGVLSITLARGYIELPASVADFEADFVCSAELSPEATYLRTTTDCEQIVFSTYSFLEQPPARTADYVFDAVSSDLLWATDERAWEWGPCSGVYRYELGEVMAQCAAVEVQYCTPLSQRDGG
jgi:hypothetical protein